MEFDADAGWKVIEVPGVLKEMSSLMVMLLVASIQTEAATAFNVAFEITKFPTVEEPH